MTIKVNERQANLILKAKCRQDLGIFTQRAFSTVDPGADYLHNWHIDCIAEYLKACTNREIKRLIINIPPRYMKSISVTVAWPAWLLGRNPSERILAASYSQQLSTKHSLDCRRLIQSDWYNEVFPNVELADDENQKTRFETTERGHRIAVSVGGSATGEGGDILIVDDPHNPMQAASEVQRETALDWFDQTFTSRLNNKKNGVIVVVMQRLHSDDLTGHLLKKGGWEHLTLPAYAEKKQFIQIGNFKKERPVGDVLHAAREDLKQLERIKIDLGSYAYSGQYQQSPVPSEGGIFKKEWFRRYSLIPETTKRIVQSWDTAVKATQLNDFSVCTTWAEFDNAYYLLDTFAQRLEYPDLKRQVITMAAKWQPDTILIEDKASGQALLQDLKKETKLPLIAIMPISDKITRASNISALVEAGRVLLPERANWLPDFELEVSSFPLSTHDDQVDSMTQFLNWAKDRRTNNLQIRRL